MGVDSVKLESLDGKILDEVLDGVGSISALLAIPQAIPYQMIGRVQEYGETVFSHGEMDAFLKDWHRLTAFAPDLVSLKVLAPRHKADALKNLAKIAAMAQRCRAERLLLRFSTD